MVGSNQVSLLFRNDVVTEKSFVLHFDRSVLGTKKVPDLFLLN